MKRKAILAMVLAVGLLAACGNDTQEDKKNDNPDFYAAGVAHKQAGDYEQAQTAFLEAVEQEPEDSLSYLALADIYIRQEKYQAAWDILNQGLESSDASSIESKLLEFNSANVICDSDGLQRGKSHFSDGQLQWCHVYGYEDSDFTKITHYDGQMSVLGTVELTYDQAGKPVQSYIYYTNTGNLEKLTMEYNEAGQLVKTVEYGLDDGLIGYSENTFDENGYKIGENHYDAQGQLHWQLSYTHDVENRKSTRITSFYGKQVGTSENTYSEAGYSNGGKSRFQGNYDRQISYTVNYGGDHVRKEVFESETTYTRVICFNAPLSQLY